MKKYTIQEVARLHDTTKKTLLYYEKIGIFKPSYVHDKTAYRYYTSSQFSKLKTILALKDLDTPLDEIKLYLENTTSLNAIQFIKIQLEKIQEKKDRLSEVEEQLVERLGVYEHAYRLDERYLGHINFKDIELRKICYFPCENYPLGEEVLLTYRKIIEYLKLYHVRLSRYYGDIYFREGFTGDMMSHVGVFSLIPESVVLEENVKILPKGTYASMYKLGGYPDEKQAQFFLQEVERKGFQIDSDIVAFALLDYGDTKDVDRMLYEFQVKVK